MKTIAKTLLAAAAAVAGSTTVAQAGFNEDRYANRYHPVSTAACADGSCELGHCPDCPTGDCTTGECRHGGCADGSCGIGTGYGTYGTASRSDYGPVPVSQTTRPYVPTATPHYTGYRPNAACPGGVCPPTAGSYGVGYRQPLPAANCVNGNCRTLPYPQQRATAPRWNLFGLRW